MRARSVGREPALQSRRPGRWLHALCALWLGASPAAADEVLVAAAASLREPVQAMARIFESQQPGDRVRVSFGSSSALALQVRHGAPIDVFLSADAMVMEDLVAGGFVQAESHFALASNRLVVVGPRDAAPEIRTSRDLLGPDVRRFALPAQAVPLGRYGREWLAARGLWDGLESRTVATEHARATLAAVEGRYADAAIVYVTDARTSQRVETLWRISDAEQPTIVYSIGRVNAGPAAMQADRFVALARSPGGARILEESGFVPVSTAAPGPTTSDDADMQAHGP